MNALVTKLMAKDPEGRYASADELSDDLRRVSRGLRPTAVGGDWGAHAQPTKVASSNLTNGMPPVRPAPRRRRRGLPWLLVVVGAILLFLGTFGVLEAFGPDATNGWFDIFRGDNNPQSQPAGPARVRVPDVAGLTRGKAEQRLSDEGLVVGQITPFPSDRVAAGRVIEPGIDAGNRVKRGTEVNLTVSSGPQPVSSASPSASVQSSPEPGAASASSSASSLPAQQEDRQTVQGPAKARNTPRANVQERPTVRGQNASAPAAGAADDKGNRGSSGESGRGRNSGPGGGRGKQ